MALVKYNTSNLAYIREGGATIRINRKSAIAISKDAVVMMELSAGDTVGFFQDDEEPYDWYIAKDPEGFTLRDNGKSSGLSFNSTALAKMLLDSAELEDRSYKFKIANEYTPVDNEDGSAPTNAWCIIIASAKP